MLQNFFMGLAPSLMFSTVLNFILFWFEFEFVFVCLFHFLFEDNFDGFNLPFQLVTKLKLRYIA